MTIHRKRATAFIALALAWWLLFLLSMPGQAVTPMLDMHLTMTAFATSHPCPPNCPMIPTESGTPDKPYLPYHIYLPYFTDGGL